MQNLSKEELFLLKQELRDATPGVKRRSNLVMVIVTAVLAPTLSSCTATHMEVAAMNTKSTGFGYPNPAKPKDPTKKTAVGIDRTVTSSTVATATYLGSAPYICTPSGFGRKPSCFARP